MSISIFKKAVAALCGAATLLTVGAAFSASAADGARIYADQIYAEPGETVTFGVNIENNPGYVGAGIALLYDERLEPQGVSGLSIAKKQGSGSTGISGIVTINPKKQRIGWTSSGTEDCATDGAIWTVELKVLSDAKPGDTFEMGVNVTQFVNSRSEDKEYTAEAGWIKIKDVTTTEPPQTTTEPPKTTTEEPPVTTAEPPQTTVTEEPGTTAAEEPGTTTVSETEAPATTDSSATQNTGNQPGPGTGDAGLGLAVAGLMAAAAAAVAIRKKQH